MATTPLSTGTETYSTRDAIWDKTLRWLFFSVIIAVLPILFNGLSAVTRNERIEWRELFTHGELLLAAAIISAGAGSELFGRSSAVFRRTRLIMVGMTYLIFFLASLWFASIADLIREGGKMNTDLVAWGSVLIFFASVVTGACCMVLSEVR